jgi:hypothetical protein
MPLSPLWLPSLWSWLASLSSGALWSYGSAFIVLVGVVGETITELTAWITSESVRKRAAKISAIVLILGLTGDLLGIRETQIEVASLTKEAADAKKSAEGAASAAASAKTSADNANTVAGKALDKSNAANEAAGKAQEKVGAVANRAEALGSQLDFRGPRAELFNGTNLTRPGVGTFLAKIKPFARQKVETRINLSDIPDPQENWETRELAGSLEFFLGLVGGWRVSRGDGGHNWGVDVVVNRKATRETREAASALASGLGDVGLTGMQRQKPEVVEAQEGSATDRTNFLPDTILLFVGKHP